MNDLLKREKVLRTVQKMFECCTTYDIIDYRDLMIEAIKVLPPERQLNLNRPQGEWKHLGGDEWLCSNCGHVVQTEGSWEHPLERGKDYCEHCGARMKGANK